MDAGFILYDPFPLGENFSQSLDGIIGRRHPCLRAGHAPTVHGSACLRPFVHHWLPAPRGLELHTGIRRGGLERFTQCSAAWRPDLSWQRLMRGGKLELRSKKETAISLSTDCRLK